MQHSKLILGVFFTAAVFGGGVLCGSFLDSIKGSTESTTAGAASSEGVAPLLNVAESDHPLFASPIAITKPGIPPKEAPEVLPGTAPGPIAETASPALPASANATASASLNATAAASNAVPSAAPSVSPTPGKAATPRTVQDITPFASSTSGFSLHKKGPGKGGPTLLIIGGIQGDEPGGFSAAALIASHYKINSGEVWVVPDLNFASILERNRGLFGDMNRKFASLDKSDPEYAQVERIKSVLLNQQVDLVLNLHDGSGFYRPTWEDGLRNPKRWGQSVIIDQKEVNAPRFNQLEAMASKAGEDVNNALLDPAHRYHTHNTNTKLGDMEMEKTLSYFAVCNGKPAFGIEASKEFTTEYRSYYHVMVIESFMRQMGIEFERDFPLTPTGVLAALNSNLTVAAYDNRLVLPLDNARPTLAMIPFKKGAEPQARTSKPLLALVPDKDKNDWRVAYGNRTLTRVKPAFMDFDNSLSTMDMVLDGKPYTVGMGEVVSVKNSFLVKGQSGYRVNAIGAQKDKNGTEANVKLAKEDFIPRFSVDKSATVYRVEIYKGDAFAGMVFVRFGEAMPAPSESLTATNGPESALGF